MGVYKAFYKIIYKNLPQLIIYVVLFLFFAIFLANIYTDPLNTDFTEAKIDVAFINHDRDSKLVEGLANYLSRNANFIDIPDDTQRLQDALFFRNVEYIIRVPKGFTEGFIKGKGMQIEKTGVPSSASGIYMDIMVNKYLNTAKMYIDNVGDLTLDQLVGHIEKDLSQGTEVAVFRPDLDKTRNERCAYYFNFLAYSVFAIMILGVSEVIMIFNNKDLKRRNLCSPLKLSSMNFQMVLGNISFALATWVILIFASFIMYGRYMFTVKGLLFILSSFVFTLSALSISYLIGNVVKSKNAISAVSNVVSLGTCFISGVFVPQAFIGEKVLKIASFTPTYWYVKANNDIGGMADVNMDNIGPIFVNMLVITGFSMASLAIALVIIKQRRLSE